LLADVRGAEHGGAPGLNQHTARRRTGEAALDLHRPQLVGFSLIVTHGSNASGTRAGAKQNCCATDQCCASVPVAALWIFNSLHFPLSPIPYYLLPIPYILPCAVNIQARIPFCMCMRLAACCKTTLCGPSITSSVTSSPRWAGRQCMKNVPFCACDMSLPFT